MDTPEHDYIEYQLTVENGEIVSCRPFSEGKQIDPLPGVKVYKPAGEKVPDWYVKRVERRLTRAISSLQKR